MINVLGIEKVYQKYRAQAAVSKSAKKSSSPDGVLPSMSHIRLGGKAPSLEEERRPDIGPVSQRAA